MTKINSLNIKVTGSDLRVSTTSETVVGGQTWETYVEALSASQWNAATGLTARQIINAWDVDNVVFTTDNDVSQFTDKSGNSNNLSVLGLVNLLKDGGRNVAEIVSAFVGSDSLATYTSGNSVSKPFVIGLCYKFNQIPTSEQTLWSIGHSSTSARRSISITSSGYVKYAYSDDSGNTLTATGADVIPLGTPCIIWVACERTKIRVYVHGGSLDHKKTISTEGAFNTTSTITEMAIGGYYTAGVTSQGFASGYYLGHVFADGVCKDTYEAIEATCSMFNVSFTTADVGDFSTGLVSVIQGPGAGNLGTSKADVVDLVAGTVFTANGTLPTAGTGRFHNAIQTTGFTSSIFLKATTPSAWDLFNSSADFTLYIRYKTGTLDASNRTIIQLGDSTTQYWKLSHNNGPILFIVDTSTKATSTVTLASDTWYSIILKRASSVVTLQVNGETPVTASSPGTRSVVGQGFTIGGSWATSTTSQFLGRGLIDCIALWSRAFSTDEVVQIRNTETGRDGFFEYLQSEIATGGGGSTLRYLGTMIAGTGNTNGQLKSGSDYTSSSSCQWVTFISPYSGSLREVTMWFKTASGYGGGNYGTYELTVRNDNSGVPGATIISKVSSVTGFTANGSANSNQYRRITFTTIGSVVAGTKYHMVIRNTEASPSANWTSLNMVEGNGITVGNDYTAARPLWTHTDFMFHHSDNTYLKHTPLVTFGVDTNADSTTDAWFGNPHADAVACYSGGNYSDPIGGTKQTRIRIKVSASFQIVGAAIAAFRTSGTGDVTATLKSSGGSTLATATLPGSQFNQTAAGGSRANIAFWSYGLFNSNPTLTSGNTYYLDLSAPSGTVVYPCIYTNTADSVNSGFLATMDGTKGGWWGSTLPLQSSTNSGSSFSTYLGGGSTNRSMAFYLSGY